MFLLKWESRHIEGFPGQNESLSGTLLPLTYFWFTRFFISLTALTNIKFLYFFLPLSLQSCFSHISIDMQILLGICVVCVLYNNNGVGGINCSAATWPRMVFHFFIFDFWLLLCILKKWWKCFFSHQQIHFCLLQDKYVEWTYIAQKTDDIKLTRSRQCQFNFHLAISKQ